MLHVEIKDQECKYKMSVNGEENQILISEEERDLGVMFDNAHSFHPRIYNCINNANKMLIQRPFSYLDITCKLYQSSIKPQLDHLWLDHANTVWYPAPKRLSIIIQRVQRRATKLVKECYSMAYLEILQYFIYIPCRVGEGIKYRPIKCTIDKST